MVEQAQALLLNLGTPTLERWTVARLTAQRAHACRIPIVADPAGCGSTPSRTEQTRLLLEAVRVDVVRGSAPEIAALGRIPAPGARQRGVAAENNAELDTTALAHEASRALGCTVVVTGAVEAISDGRRALRHATCVPLLEHVVGAGDVLTALIGACRVVEADSDAASLAGLAAFTTAAQASHSEGHGTSGFGCSTR
jgi:hydroxyethylthiazole kinase